MTNDNVTNLNEENQPLDNTNDDLTGVGGTVVGNTSFTQEEIENANKPQPNVILNTTDVNSNMASNYRDPERVGSRSNEAADLTDTNSGDIISGAAKGVSQS